MKFSLCGNYEFTETLTRLDKSTASSKNKTSISMCLFRREMSLMKLLKNDNV